MFGQIRAWHENEPCASWQRGASVGRSHVLAGDRETLDEAYAGDIIGLHNHGTIQIGDSFTSGETLNFTGIPHFAPELFRRVVLKDPMKSNNYKRLQQLSEEGATCSFMPQINNDLIFGGGGRATI